MPQNLPPSHPPHLLSSAPQLPPLLPPTLHHLTPHLPLHTPPFAPSDGAEGAQVLLDPPMPCQPEYTTFTSESELRDELQRQQRASGGASAACACTSVCVLRRQRLDAGSIPPHRFNLLTY